MNSSCIKIPITGTESRMQTQIMHTKTVTQIMIRKCTVYSRNWPITGSMYRLRCLRKGDEHRACTAVRSMAPLPVLVCCDRGSECLGCKWTWSTDSSVRWVAGRLVHAAAGTADHAVDGSRALLWSDARQRKSHLGKSPSSSSSSSSSLSLSLSWLPCLPLSSS